MTTPILTTARNALWDSITNWHETASAFRRQYRFDSPNDFQPVINPSMSDLPAVAILLTALTPQWRNTDYQLWHLRYRVQMWTYGWSLTEPEALLEKLFNAFHRATPVGSSASYIKTATGHHIVPNEESIDFATVTLTDEEGRPHCQAIRTEFQLTLRPTKQPVTSG